MRPCDGCDDMIESGKYCRDCQIEILAAKKRAKNKRLKESSLFGVRF